MANVSIKKVGIFGSTGSIGTQTLKVIASHPDKFEAIILVAKSNAELLVAQAIQFKPKYVGIEDKSKFDFVKNKLSSLGIKVFHSLGGIVELAKHEDYESMIAAIVGFDGLFSVYEAIKNKKTIGLANKESIVVAGDLMTDLASKNKVQIIPVNSEHSAIFQCLLGENKSNVEEIILTASGGPFRGKKINFLQNVKRFHALQHPIWKMGEKISIDSATLMNKGLEIIEAKWLFELQEKQIQVIIHPESIIHGIIAFNDGSYKLQMSCPDMQIPINYALHYPERMAHKCPKINFEQLEKLRFEPVDNKTFKCIDIARHAVKEKYNKACVMNAANEEAVKAFLNNDISFLNIIDVIEHTCEIVPLQKCHSIEEYKEFDIKAREISKQKINTLQIKLF